MPALIPATADEILAMSIEELQDFRGAIFIDFEPKGASKELLLALMRFGRLLTIVQDMREWGKLAEPGIAPKLFDLGKEWEAEIEPARELDRLSVESHREMAAHFEEEGGKAGLAAAIEQVNRLKG